MCANIDKHWISQQSIQPYSLSEGRMLSCYG